MVYLDIARVCIEMPAREDFVSQFDVLDEEGNRFNIRVEHAWAPRSCSCCSIYGHSTSHCLVSGQENGAQIMFSLLLL